MERQKHIFGVIIALILSAGSFQVSGDNGDYNSRRKTIYDAYINGDIGGWMSVMNYLENLSAPSVDERLELLNYYYGYTGYLLGSDQEKTAKAYVERAGKIIDGILKENPQNATALAFKGSFISFKIAMNKLKAVTLGPESMKYINRAYKTDATDVQALTDKGNLLFYAPGLFGGNKKEALTYFERAIKRLEDTNDTANNWFYLNLMVLLTQHYEKMGQKEKAQALSAKIRRIEPDFDWMKQDIDLKTPE